MPFRGMQQPGLGYSVVRGLRPKKPRNPSNVGFSKSLWACVQLCWDGDKKRRPKVAEVVKRLEEATANNPSSRKKSDPLRPRMLET